MKVLVASAVPEDFVTDGASRCRTPVRGPEAPAGIIAEVLDDPAGAAIGAADRAAALGLSRERDASPTTGEHESVLTAAP